MEAIVAATRDTADALDILARAGTLEPGKQADLFVVKDAPLRDISSLKSPETVALVEFTALYRTHFELFQPSRQSLPLFKHALD